MPIYAKIEELRYLPEFKNHKQLLLFISSFKEQEDDIQTDADLLDEQVLCNWDTSWAAKGVFSYLVFKNTLISKADLVSASIKDDSIIDAAIFDLNDLSFITGTDGEYTHSFDEAEGNEIRNTDAWRFIGPILEDRELSWVAKGIYVSIARSQYESTWYGLMHFSKKNLEINQVSGDKNVILHPDINKFDIELTQGLNELLDKEYIKLKIDLTGTISAIF